MYPIAEPRKRDEIEHEIQNLNGRLYWLERELEQRRKLDEDWFQELIERSESRL